MNARGFPWFLPPSLASSTSLEYFFSTPLLHSQAKSRLKSGVGWSGKIYENWTAFQCFSPHVMLISSSKGSWPNFLFRNRRIFSIETFVIYKLGRLSALPLQQASRWQCTSSQWVEMYCDVFWIALCCVVFSSCASMYFCWCIVLIKCIELWCDVVKYILILHTDVNCCTGAVQWMCFAQNTIFEL